MCGTGQPVEDRGGRSGLGCSRPTAGRCWTTSRLVVASGYASAASSRAHAYPSRGAGFGGTCVGGESKPACKAHTARACASPSPGRASASGSTKPFAGSGSLPTWHSTGVPGGTGWPSTRTVGGAAERFAGNWSGAGCWGGRTASASAAAGSNRCRCGAGVGMVRGRAGHAGRAPPIRRTRPGRDPQAKRHAANLLGVDVVTGFGQAGAQRLQDLPAHGHLGRRHRRQRPRFVVVVDDDPLGREVLAPVG